MLDYIRLIVSPITGPFISGDFWPFILRFMPYVVFLELPVTILIAVGIIRYFLERRTEGPRRPYYPDVSCIITCYSEGIGVQDTIRTVAEQIYPGRIQMLALIDGAVRNKLTYDAAEQMVSGVNVMKNRQLIIVPKWQRGGRVSSLNTGLNYADGELRKR